MGVIYLFFDARHPCKQLGVLRLFRECVFDTLYPPHAFFVSLGSPFRMRHPDLLALIPAEPTALVFGGAGTKCQFCAKNQRQQVETASGFFCSFFTQNTVHFV